MNKSTLMIRMIDIVFILLFGFIAVSQIGSSTPIEPPKSKEAMEGAPQNAKTIIIGVTNKGTYPIDNDGLILNNKYELRQYLARLIKKNQLEGKQVGVRIRANWDSPVEYGLNVARICRELGIPKGLDVVKYNMD